jgi:N6-adenosine-specific RNA methylase IME4
MTSDLATIRPFLGQNLSDGAIAERVGLNRHQVRRLRHKAMMEAATGPAVQQNASGPLVLYETACRALAQAKSVDEVQDVRDKAEAIRIYARMAKNKDLEVDAAEIRIRAERRLGEMIAGQKETVGLNRGTRGQLRGDVPVGGSAPVPPTDDTPTLADMGIDKKLAAHSQKLAAVPQSEFDGMIGEWRGQVSQANERVAVNLLRAGDKAQRRAAREAELGAKQRALPDKRYGVILADPPWRFEPYSRDTGMDRAADNHYPTKQTDDIAALDVPSIAADDCVLLLWATAPMLPDALNVMGLWGFYYKSHFIWHKDASGTGYWNRNCHELLLIGSKGKIPAPEQGGSLHPSVFLAPRREHSRKPDYPYGFAEFWWPSLAKIELYCRGAPRHGWDAWGNEAEQLSTEASASPAICGLHADGQNGGPEATRGGAAAVNPKPAPPRAQVEAS